ncbi:hypothetical protein AArcMg_2302 [Natrarchaeobaculum sulfurireducens]|uniref:Uncharacterized protein n=2 Tax=Natrarchaeobaculum sulfurireducens TaxID=2044521 RepID=A0A346PS03_9EURY|nr:hypothetical protein AArcMg_2302 [Natrarchaeobaculum sulfurireducens]
MLAKFCDRYDLGEDEYQNMKRIKDDMEKTFSVDDYSVNGRYIHGVFATGTYGTGADHIDTEEDKIKRNARSPVDAVVLPYYFLFALPENDTERGLLILQKIGNKGTKGVVEEILKHWLELGDKKGNVEFDPEVTEDLIKQILEADRLLELKFTKKQSSKATHEVVSDLLSDVIDEEGFLEQKIIFSGTRTSNLPIAKEKLSEALFNKETTSVKVLGQEFNQGSLKAEVNGSQRTFSLFQDEAEMERLIDEEKDDVDLDANKHPTMESISEIAIEFANEIFDKYNEEPIDQ